LIYIHTFSDCWSATNKENSSRKMMIDNSSSKTTNRKKLKLLLVSQFWRLQFKKESYLFVFGSSFIGI
jgi:hypothetical protein